MIIAIDGPSGTGKSTVAKAVAKRLGFTFFDTGAMYRSFAWYVFQQKIDPLNEEQVSKLLETFQFEIKTGKDKERNYFVNETDVTRLIRSSEISNIASQIATYTQVRKAMVRMQRKFGRSQNVVFEGRDMGTVVFPDADLKIYLTAEPKVRAERRYREFLVKFPDLSQSMSLEQILVEMQKRDETDASRSVSPLKQASDAILIDTSHSSIEQVIQKIISLKPKKKRKIAPMKFSYWIIYMVAKAFFKIFFRLRVYGLEHFRSGRGILIANHCSLYDPPVLSISYPEEVHFIAKESLFRVPLLGSLIRMLNSHPVSHSANDMKVLREMVNLLKNRKKLIIFPEGRRSETGELQPFKKGLFFLAKSAKSTVFPAYISGTFKAWPIFQKFPRLFGKITCVFGTPIEWDEFEDLPKQEAENLFNERCSKAISDLKIWLENGAEGTPP